MGAVIISLAYCLFLSVQCWHVFVKPVRIHKLMFNTHVLSQSQSGTLLQACSFEAVEHGWHCIHLSTRAVCLVCTIRTPTVNSMHRLAQLKPLLSLMHKPAQLEPLLLCCPPITTTPSLAVKSATGKRSDTCHICLLQMLAKLLPRQALTQPHKARLDKPHSHPWSLCLREATCKQLALTFPFPEALEQA